MKNIQKIGIRTLGILALLLIFNFIYSEFFFQKDIKRYADIINILPAPQDSAQILYFAESSNFTTHKLDIDKRKISEMVAAYYPTKKLATINKGALHAGIYKTLLQQLPEKNKIETVIITLNLRSFGADWIYSKLETSLQKSIVLLKPGLPLLNRIALSFKGYDVKTNKERLEQVIHHWRTDKLNFPYEFKYSNALDWEHALNKKGFWFENGQKNYDKTTLACHYIKSYAFYIDPNKNPRVIDFDEIVAYCHQKGWNVVLNLMAENIEKANELIGKDLVFLMNRNRDFLVKHYSKMGAMVVDNLNDISTQYYIDQNWTTEHYSEEGRLIVAKNVADSLKKIYPDAYQTTVFNQPEKKSHFINTGEQLPDWSNFNTLSDTKVYKDSFSSKIDESQPYSITLSQPLNFIPDTLLNKVKVQYYAYQTEHKNQIKTVVELQRDFGEPKWLIQTVSLTKLNTWEKLDLTFTLNDIDLKNYNLIKVYCSNKSADAAYINHFEIIFE